MKNFDTDICSFVRPLSTILFLCLGWRYILTAKFFWLLYFFCLVQLRLWFFVASLNSYLIYYTDDDKDKSKCAWSKNPAAMGAQNPATTLCECPSYIVVFRLSQPLYFRWTKTPTKTKVSAPWSKNPAAMGAQNPATTLCECPSYIVVFRLSQPLYFRWTKTSTKTKVSAPRRAT